MNKFRPHINPIYPANNILIFEEWFRFQWDRVIDNPILKEDPKTDRYLLPFNPTSYWVNNNYAQDEQAKKEAQEFIDSLPNNVKYFVICQYDDGCLIDWKGKDVLEFNMSKKIGVELPLLCMPHPYSFSSPKKYLVSFVGSRTHPIRNKLEQFKGKETWYISYEPHDIVDYCRIMHESLFTLCPRGYGANSFRICEALQYNSIPVYISDEFIEPFGVDFDDIGVKVSSENVNTLYELLTGINPYKRYKELEKSYNEYYTYNGCFNHIIKSLEAEFNSRK